MVGCTCHSWIYLFKLVLGFHGGRMMIVVFFSFFSLIYFLLPLLGQCAEVGGCSGCHVEGEMSDVGDDV